jgi:hypothetical protein
MRSSFIEGIDIGTTSNCRFHKSELTVTSDYNVESFKNSVPFIKILQALIN